VLAVVVYQVDLVRLVPAVIVLMLVAIVKLADWMDRRGRK